MKGSASSLSNKPYSIEIRIYEIKLSIYVQVYVLLLKFVAIMKKRGTPNPVANHHAVSYPKWIITAMVKSTTRQGGGVGVTLWIIIVR